jgi:penicillin-binding protein 1A
MKSLFEDVQEVAIPRRKLVGRVLLGLLVLAAALVGVTAGLLLVYSTDLPQVDELEHYRPSAITELYDGGAHHSFALQRRVVAATMTTLLFSEMP